MPPLNIVEWNKCACFLRCFTELQSRRGKPLPSPQELYDRFLSDYPSWATAPGTTSTSEVCEIAKALGIATTVNVFIDPGRLVEESKHPLFVGLIGSTERLPKQEGGGLQIIYHGLLIDQITDHSFRLWNPSADGSSELIPNCPWQFWADWKMHGLVLYR